MQENPWNAQLQPVEFQPKPTPYRSCHLIPGITGTKEHWRIAGDTLRNAQENNKPIYDAVAVHDSSITGKNYDPRHFEKIGQSFLEDLKKAKKTGGKVDFITTSLAASDLVEVFKAVEKIENDPNFFRNKENAEAIRFILISPWGFTKGFSEAFSSLGRFGRLLKEMALGGDEMGINSLQLIKPRGVDVSELTLAVTAAYPKRVQKLEGQPEITTLDTPGLERQSEEYFNKLTQKDREKLTAIDSQINTAIKAQNLELFRKLLRSRGVLLQNPIWNIAGGKELYAKEPFDFSKSMQALGQLAISAYKNARSILQSTLFGKPYERFMQLAESGVEIDFIVPELDIVIPASFIQRFMDEAGSKGAKSTGITAKTSTHISTYSFNLEALVKAARQLF